MIDSLRTKIGVVPQDPMLFNDSVINNVRYAKLSASDEEVYDACKAAAVHEKILTFPDGESTLQISGCTVQYLFHANNIP